MALFQPNAYSAIEDGGRDGGGGARYDAVFRLRANALIGEIAKSQAANALCPASSMQAALNASQIFVVSELKDSQGNPIRDRELDAYSAPGSIQLLEASWSKFFDPTHSAVAGLDVLVLHEVYRTTTSCDDDKFAISDKIPGYLEQPTIDSRIFTFAYKPSDLDIWPTHSVMRLCSADPQPGVRTICLGFHRWPDPEYQNSVVLQQGVVAKDPYWKSGQSSISEYYLANADFEARTRALTANERRQFENMLAFATPARPFYLVLDAFTGNWFFGLDPAHLLPLK